MMMRQYMELDGDASLGVRPCQIEIEIWNNDGYEFRVQTRQIRVECRREVEAVEQHVKAWVHMVSFRRRLK
jgi:hypothetical protein